VLERVEELAALDPNPGTTEFDELELFSCLVEKYEAENFPIGLPEATVAIEFRMDQQGLRQRDLIPFLGSRSKVSEVLSGKRPLTLSMMRALHSGLAIPAQVLLQEPGGKLPNEVDVDWGKFPLREMVKRKWIDVDMREIRDRAEEFLRSFFGQLREGATFSSLYRRSITERSARKMDHFALVAWTARVMTRAANDRLTEKYTRGTVDSEFLSEVARFSSSEQGPLIAKEFLEQNGIKLIVEPHLPKTHVDGAAMLLGDVERPIIALTLRHDRIDNFWFSLLHELAHVARHLENPDESFVDDFDFRNAVDPREGEADLMAGEALIPSGVWRSSRASQQRTASAAIDLALELRIHPAIVAGRIRHETRNFKVLSSVVGHGRVRRLFPEVEWP